MTGAIVGVFDFATGADAVTKIDEIVGKEETESQ